MEHGEYADGPADPARIADQHDDRRGGGLHQRAAPAGTMPLPKILPQIARRAGLDLNPIDVNDPAEAAWLETLVWPEQTDQLVRLRAAMTIAAEVRPRLTKGDLRHDLIALAAEMPQETTRVIFHTAMLAYISPRSAREAFARSVNALCNVWIAKETPQVFPDIAARADAAPLSGRFLVAQNGTPVAWADPHGATLDWIAEPAAQAASLRCGLAISSRPMSGLPSSTSSHSRRVRFGATVRVRERQRDGSIAP
jgi:hypothetical protein